MVVYCYRFAALLVRFVAHAYRWNPHRGLAAGAGAGQPSLGPQRCEQCVSCTPGDGIAARCLHRLQ